MNDCIGGETEMRKSVFVFSVCMICLMGCAKKEAIYDSDKISIVLLNGWGTMETDNQVMRDIYSDFEKENPDISLKLISMPSPENVTSKVKEMISVGKLPELIYIGETGIDKLYPFMVLQGYVTDFMPYIKEDKEFESMISPHIMNRWKTEEDQLYTITDVLSTSGYWYNKQIFENAGIKKVPETWEEFFACCGKIEEWAEKEKLDTVPLSLDVNTAACIIQASIQANDINFSDDADIVRSLTILKNVKKYADMEDNYSYRDNLRSFNIGRCAICINGISSEQALNENLKMEYVDFPTLDGKKTGLISAYPGYFMSSSSDENQKKACIRFLKYMLSEKVQSRIWKETGQLPSNPNIDIDRISNKEDRRYQAYTELMNSDVIKELPRNDWGDHKMDTFGSSIFQYLQGGISDEDMCKLIKSK